MSNPTAPLTEHKPEHEFLVCIDSDGCAFDTMELKHKECFIPNIIKHWGLQAISKYAREAAEFVNLYSKWRGINRFPALLDTFDLLAERDEVKARGFKLPAVPNLRKWVVSESKLGNPALEAYCARLAENDMHTALTWSKAVNDTVADIVGTGLPPFPFVRDSLIKAGAKADLMVCSATPSGALTEEWKGQDLAQYVFTIAGQEQGKKADHIALASEGRYNKTNVLMVGDAPGDQKAAEANGALFYPINPGHEEQSWERFHNEALDKFFAGEFAGDYQDKVRAEFEALLPGTPPWKQ